VQRLERDYGYDLLLFTYDAQGYLEPGLVFLQVKAAESLPPVGPAYVFDQDIRDYNLWMLDNLPVILILFDASRKRAAWLSVQHYFRADVARQPKKGAKTIRVRVPVRQVVNRRAIASLRKFERVALSERKGTQP
jgi:hypothetical protein